MKCVAIALLLAMAANCHSRPQKSGPKPEKVQPEPEKSQPKPTLPLPEGEYRLSLTATRGSRAGASAEGPAWLHATSSDDVSPRTGKRAKDQVPSSLYGWTGIDLKLVGAPLCPDSPEPSPASRDPTAPGLLVIEARAPQRGTSSGERKVPTILVATLTNLRHGKSWLDGCGFAMYVLGRDGPCYTGQWSEWGLLRDGQGSFRLCPG